MSKKSTHQVYLNRNNRSVEQRLRYKFSILKSDAARRHVKFTLTPEDLIEMWNKQNGLCSYTHRRMTISIGKGLFWRNWSMSVERLDPSAGYTKENCVLVRYDANRQKGKRNFFDANFMETFPEFVSNALSFRPELDTIAA